jgi:hypothetical protein
MSSGDRISLYSCIVFVVLAIATLLYFWKLSKENWGGEADFARLGQILWCMMGYIAFTFLSLIAALLTGIRVRWARWLLVLIVPMAGLAGWFLILLILNS